MSNLSTVGTLSRRSSGGDLIASSWGSGVTAGSLGLELTLLLAGLSSGFVLLESFKFFADSVPMVRLQFGTAGLE